MWRYQSWMLELLDAGVSGGDGGGGSCVTVLDLLVILAQSMAV